jgi:acyl-CoA synthetase (AMP-forming)/AMP-acid ligase II
MGKAIPNAEVMVVRPDGTPCDPGEPGELVHRGALVSLGYWNDPAKTAERFKPAPGHNPALPLTEMAVWSGDTVRMDEEGFLYFIGRNDDMIKTSGYRVSPTEVEEVVYARGLWPKRPRSACRTRRWARRSCCWRCRSEARRSPKRRCRRPPAPHLPAYMVPAHVDPAEAACRATRTARSTASCCSQPF